MNTNIPDNADVFEQFVEGLAVHPLWSFSNYGDAQRTGHEPLIVSEFGNWEVPSLRQFGGGLLEWFDALKYEIDTMRRLDTPLTHGHRREFPMRVKLLCFLEQWSFIKILDPKREWRHSPPLPF